MMFSAGMGIGLMFYGVAEPLYHYVSPPPGTVEARPPTAAADRDGHHAVPLDAAPVGDLRGGRHGHRVRHLPQGPLAADLRRLRPAARQDGTSTARSARSSTSWRSSPPCSVRPPRWASARCRSAAGCEFNGWVDEVGHAASWSCIIAVLTVAFVASAISGIAQGHPVAVQHQHGAGRRSCAVRVRGRPDRLHPQPAPDRARRLRPATCPRWRRAPRRAAATRWPPGCRAGRSSTGPGGSPGRPSSACSSPGSAAAAPSGSSSPACCWCRASVSLVWFAIFGGAAIDAQRRRHGDTGRRRRRRSTSTARCSSCSTHYPLATMTHACW